MAPKQRRLEGDWGVLAELHTEINQGIPNEAVLTRLRGVLESLAGEAHTRVRDLQSRINAAQTKAVAPSATGDDSDEHAALNSTHRQSSYMDVDPPESAIPPASPPDSPVPASPTNSGGHSEPPENNTRESPHVSGSEHGIGSTSNGDATLAGAIASSNPDNDHDEHQELGQPDQNHHMSQRFVPNPKAEFVPSQELPVAALGLFEEGGHPGPPNSEPVSHEEEESIKRRLGVESYPTVPMEEMLPGTIPNDDFTHAKPSNQVQATTYATFLEPYFQPFTEEDLGFLQQRTVGSEVVSFGRSISPYVIPPLGPSYHELWAEEDRHNGHTVQPVTPLGAEEAKRYEPLGGSNDLSDPALEHGDVGLGPLTARLMAALVPEDEEEDDESLQTPAAAMIPPPSAKNTVLFGDFSGLEERLKREFRYVGILDVSVLRKFNRDKRAFRLALPSSSVDGDDPSLDDGMLGGDDFYMDGSSGGSGGSGEIDWVNGTEDDEICRELRDLQAKLRATSSRNLKYKRRLLPAVQEQMAWQEYSTILADLDKQVDQAYLKRLKVPKAKTKKAPTPGPSSGGESPQVSLGGVDTRPAVRALLDKRARWITKIGSVFKPPYLMMRSHEFPKFEHVDEEDEDDDEVEA